MTEHVVLVDESDRELGSVEKLQAHVAPALHRAVSVLLVSPQGQLLLQRRAATKYHSPHRWSNSCCGHPRPGETADQAAHRRLREELGIRCSLLHLGAVRYCLDVGQGLVEHELNQLFVGEWLGAAQPDGAEVSAWCWLGGDTLRESVARTPHNYTAWLPTVVDAVAALTTVAHDHVPDGARRFAGAWFGDPSLRERRLNPRDEVHVVGRDGLHRPLPRRGPGRRQFAPAGPPRAIRVPAA